MVVSQNWEYFLHWFIIRSINSCSTSFLFIFQITEIMVKLQLPLAYAELSKFIHAREYERVIKSCNKREFARFFLLRTALSVFQL